MLCRGEVRAPLLSGNPFWKWDAFKSCGTYSQMIAPTSCYFGHTLTREPCGQFSLNARLASVDLDGCGSFMKDDASRWEFRAAAIEYMFQNVEQQWVDKAQRVLRQQRHLLQLQRSNSHLPAESALITVHIRWGDKKVEMELVRASKYVEAVEKIVREQGIQMPHVFVTTEDQRAISAFSKLAPDSWVVFTYSPAIMKKPVTLNGGMGEYARAQHGVFTAGSNGEPGGHSMVALLLAMEARHYVLTTGSNWSRLIDELRVNVIDAECHKCTTMVDLRPCHSQYTEEKRWC